MITLNFAPEIISTGLYAAGMARFLAGRGIQVEVVAALPHYPAWQIFEGWRGFSYRRSQHDYALNTTHCPLYVPRIPNGARRILHHLSFAATALPVALWKALTTRPDHVIVVAPALLSAPVGWLAARLSGSRLWLHVQDFEVEAAFVTGLLREDSTVGKIALAFERWMLHRFDNVSTISKPMLSKLRAKGIPEQRIREIRNWADLSRVQPIIEPSPMKAEVDVQTRFVALYSGNLANKQGLDILPRIAKQLADRRDLTIVICGDGPMRNTLAEQVSGMPNVRLIPLQPIERLGDLLGMADIHLLPQLAGAADLVLPSKLANMLSSGRPVIATAHAGTALAEEVDGVGLVIEPGDANAAAMAIVRLLDDPELRASLGKAARTRALQRWDIHSILGSFAIELEQSKSTGKDWKKGA